MTLISKDIEVRFQFRFLGQNVVKELKASDEVPKKITELEKADKVVMPSTLVRIPFLCQLKSLEKDQQVFRKPCPELDGHM